MLEPDHIANRLTGPQRRRLIALAKVGQSLPWNRTDDALEALRLVRRYSDVVDKSFADLTNNGMAVAQKILRSR